MKRLVSIGMTSLFLVVGSAGAFTNTYDDANATCGQWDDVSSTYIDMYTTVCNAGFMQGASEDTFNDDGELSRAEAAVIANRIVYGIEEYEDLDEGGSYYKNKLAADFSDAPPNEWWNEWILKAMYYVNEEGIMTGDAKATTFRPTDSITTAEFMKIMWESARQAELLDEDYDNEINYDGSTWYSSLVLSYAGTGMLDNYDIYHSQFIDFDLYYDSDSDSKYHNYDLGLNDVIDRQDAAALVYTMLYNDVISATTETSSSNEGNPDLTLSDVELGSTYLWPGDTTTVSGKIWNVGSVDAEDSVLRINVGSDYGSVTNISDIEAGSYYEFEVSIDMDDTGIEDAGNYDVYLNADDYEDIEESNEDNNEANLSFEFALED